MDLGDSGSTAQLLAILGLFFLCASSRRLGAATKSLCHTSSFPFLSSTAGHDMLKDILFTGDLLMSAGELVYIVADTSIIS